MWVKIVKKCLLLKFRLIWLKSLAKQMEQEIADAGKQFLRAAVSSAGRVNIFFVSIHSSSSVKNYLTQSWKINLRVEKVRLPLFLCQSTTKTSYENIWPTFSKTLKDIATRSFPFNSHSTGHYFSSFMNYFKMQTCFWNASSTFKVVLMNNLKWPHANHNWMSVFIQSLMQIINN